LAAVAGAYVHIPFCIRRCDYCAFATWDDRLSLLDGYVDGVRREIASVAPSLEPLTSVFFGGGTPSLLSPPQLASILQGLPLVQGAEVTVECNPDTVDAARLAGYRDAGVTRISLGVQSMVPHVLAALGRSHDPANVELAVDAVRDVGFDSFNLDLIYGSVGESLDDWRTTVRRILELGPPHVSAYGLTVEAGTPLARDVDRHPDDDVQADMYGVVDDLLAAAGLASYELSNWAVPGHECRHNQLYWSQGDYRGFGCAAHSHVGGRRWWNVRTPERYLSLVSSGASTEGGFEELDVEARAMEALQLSLRTRDGVPIGALPLEELDGLVEVVGARVVLTRAGRLLANEVAMRLTLLPAGAPSPTPS
jgi:putative oxygen-independent coproporphyrinogen III oxidase